MSKLIKQICNYKRLLIYLLDNKINETHINSIYLIALSFALFLALKLAIINSFVRY